MSDDDMIAFLEGLADDKSEAAKIHDDAMAQDEARDAREEAAMLREVANRLRGLSS